MKCKECKECKQNFVGIQTQKYCSTECYKKAKRRRYRKAHPEKKLGFKSKNCEQCGIEYKPTRSRQKFCSNVCSGRSRKKFLSIPECLEEASRKLDKTIGYVRVYCPMHPHANTWGYVYEHRLIVEGILGRLLKKDEHVHHRNGKRWDNRPENLEVLSASDHAKIRKSNSMENDQHK